MIKDFKEFVARGNVVDLAVGVIIGAAFGKIVASMVADILMPPIGLVLGKADFSNMFFSLNGTHYDTLAEAKKAAAPTINYGAFINVCIEFLIIAFCIFLVVKGINKLRKKAEPAPVTTRDCPACFEKVAVKATRCGHCTSDLQAQRAA